MIKALFTKTTTSPFVLLVSLWLILTIININKAFHIDDTFHLEAAAYISEHPIKPMSGYINWDHEPRLMAFSSLPPLFYYLIIGTQWIFGESEAGQHVLVALFSFLALFFFQKLSTLLEVKRKNFLLIIFAFCPAFIINQNLMVEVPVLATALGSLYFLLKGLQNHDSKSYLLSVLFLTLGLLFKYSLLPLFFVILISLLLSMDRKKAFFLLIPISALTFFSLWTLKNYGFLHFSAVSGSDIRLEKIIAFLSCLGSISLFSLAFIASSFPKKAIQNSIIFISALLCVSAGFVYFDLIIETAYTNFLNALFIVNGLFLIAFILRKTIIEFIKQKQGYFESTNFVLGLYLIGFSLFFALYSPFSATRHLLLIFPILLLFGHKQIDRTTPILRKMILFGSITLGLLLGVSDWQYADFYRRAAKAITVEEGKTYSIGHWGWQHYSSKAGMKVFSIHDSLNVGDLIVFPKDVHQQDLSKNVHLDTISFYTEKSNVWTFFSGKDGASMYSSTYIKPSWNLSKMPIDTVFVCRIK